MWLLLEENKWEFQITSILPTVNWVFICLE